MTWAKLDDRFHTHPKVRRAYERDRGSLALWTLALSYASDHETDGLVPAEFVRSQLPDRRERERTVRALVDTGLWARLGGGQYRIHDFLDFNPSRAELDDRRSEEREKKRRQRARRAPVSPGDSDGTSPGESGSGRERDGSSSLAGGPR